MKALHLAPDGCALTPTGLDAQRARAAALARSVKNIEHGPGELRVTFSSGVDERVVAQLVATERDCCSFLDVDYADGVLRVASDERADVVDLFAGFFREAPA